MSKFPLVFICLKTIKITDCDGSYADEVQAYCIQIFLPRFVQKPLYQTTLCLAS